MPTRRRTGASDPCLPRYEERPAPAGLKEHVACCWSFEVPARSEPFRHAIIPDGMVSVVLAAGQRPARLTVGGPCATASWVDLHPGDSFSGVRLLPGAAQVLLGVPARALQARPQPLSTVNPQLARALGGLLATAHSTPEVFAAMAQGLVLRLRGAGAPPHDAIIRRCVLELMRTHGNARIGELAQEAGISERQLRRRFLSAVGLNPKAFSRTIRVRAACIHLATFPAAPLASIAQEAGFADQAHLSREFAAVFGSPARALAGLLRGYAHGQFHTVATS